MSDRIDRILDGMRAGVPGGGPATVHVDITNACNAACVTCWDHSPLLDSAREPAWKRRRLPLDVFAALVADLAALGSVRSIIISGMGDPLVHPDVYDMLALVRGHGWHVTMLSNLVAADLDRLAVARVDQVLAGIHGVSPETYAAFHPGWDERELFTLCRVLRRLADAGTRVRHVHVIMRDNAHELLDMVRFARTFGADRVNFKLASLAAGTERCGVDAVQRDWLAAQAVPAARALAAQLGVTTNLDLFARQLDAARGAIRATVPIDAIGCFMGHVYTRITVDRDVLFCCNTEIKVGSLVDASFAELWRGDAWQTLRDRLRRGEWFSGCARCGKLEQNATWSERYRARFGDAAWAEIKGNGRRVHLPMAGAALADDDLVGELT